MALTVILAEKCIQAETLAAVILRGRKRCGNHFEGILPDGNPGVILWAEGHLYDLAEPEAYDPKYGGKWDDHNVLFVPHEPIVRQLDKAKGLMPDIRQWLKRADRIVHACDPDREGQLIGDEIMEQVGIDPKVPVSRLWCRSLEPGDIVASWNAQQANANYETWGEAAKLRREDDQFSGISWSRCVTVGARKRGHKLQPGRALPLGRVQTTALNFIVERDRERANFVPTKHYRVGVELQLPAFPNERLICFWLPSTDLPGVDENGRLTDRSVAEQLAKRVPGLLGYVKSVARQDKYERPAKPHNTASIQAACWRERKMTAQRTSKALQSLYQRGAITYPGTPSRQLPSSIEPSIMDIASAVSTLVPELRLAMPHLEAKNATEVFVAETEIEASHHAIIPTKRQFPNGVNGWTMDEMAVYGVVARQFLANLMPSKHSKHVGIETSVAGYRFTASQSFLIAPGWQIIFPEKETRPQPTSNLWAHVKTDDNVQCVEAAVVDQMTKAPALYTDGTLIEAMAAADKFTDNPAEKAILRKTEGIGTGRTRVEIVEKLLSYDLMRRTDKGLTSTGYGRLIIDSIPAQARRPQFTAKVEIELQKIIDRLEQPDTYRRETRERIVSVLDQISVPGPGSDYAPPEKAEDEGGGGHARAPQRRPRKSRFVVDTKPTNPPIVRSTT
jgi:DNA topoisomerase-3